MVILPPNGPQRPARLGSFTDDLANAAKEFLQSDVGQQVVGAATDVLSQQITQNFKQASFYSAYSSPYIYTGQDLANFITGKVKNLTAPPSPAPTGPVPVVLKRKTLIERVKPTFVIEGSFGRKVIAPYGEADPNEYKTNIRNLVLGSLGVLALFTGGAYYLGYKSGQRSRG
jgi:hypothetical protein